MKCPRCKRGLGEQPKGKLIIPEHLNYMQTATCPASGKEFFNGERSNSFPEFSADTAMLMLAYFGSMKKRR